MDKRAVVCIAAAAAAAFERVLISGVLGLAANVILPYGQYAAYRHKKTKNSLQQLSNNARLAI